MPIEKVTRFYCPKCNFMTYDEDQIAMIEKLGGKCPACQDGEGKSYQLSIHNQTKTPRKTGWHR